MSAFPKKKAAKKACRSDAAEILKKRQLEKSATQSSELDNNEPLAASGEKTEEISEKTDAVGVLHAVEAEPGSSVVDPYPLPKSWFVRAFFDGYEALDSALGVELDSVLISGTLVIDSVRSMTSGSTDRGSSASPDAIVEGFESLSIDESVRGNHTTVNVVLA